LRESLLDSVRHHLVSDVPVGLFLSSGTDSTVLASLAMECGSELRTVTLGFEEYRGSALDETLVAEQVARQCGARHETVWLRREDFEGSVEAFFAAMDMPSIDGINTWMVSMAAARLGLKVALSGLGGDEFFGGYPSFRQVPLIRAITRPFSRPRSAGRLLRTWSAPLVRRLASEKFAGLLEYGPTWEGAYMLRRATRMPWELADSARLDPQVIRLGLEALASRSLPDSRLEGLARAPLIVSYLEAVRYMRGQLLRDTDWAGMSHSLEIRVPMVDVELTRHVARHNLRAAPYGKADLLGAIADPPTRGLVEGRAKLGFSVPIRDWISSAGHGRLKERGQLPWQEIVAGRFTELAAR
jgi:asparagine synthase (glutamine-hydrolysing)